MTFSKRASAVVRLLEAALISEVTYLENDRMSDQGEGDQHANEQDLNSRTLVTHLSTWSLKVPRKMGTSTVQVPVFYGVMSHFRRYWVSRVVTVYLSLRGLPRAEASADSAVSVWSRRLRGS